MGKLSSTLGTLGKAAKRVSKSKVVKKTALAGKKAVRATRKGISGAKVQGSKFLQKSVARIKPIASDLKQGGIRKINKIVEAKAQNLIPKLSNKIEEKVNSFDPNKFLGKIFDGGLNSLNQFGSSLDGMKGRFDSTVEFITNATELASKFVKKLASAKPKKGGGGGIFGKLIQGVAVAGAAALALPTLAKVAVAGGAVAAGGSLLKKGIDFIRNRKKKKLKKKQEETKVKKNKGNANIFKSILDKFSGVLNFTPKDVKMFKSEGQTDVKTRMDTSKDLFEKDFTFKRFTNNNGDKKVHKLEIKEKDGNIISGNDTPTNRRIVEAYEETEDIGKQLKSLLLDGAKSGGDRDIDKKYDGLKKKLFELKKEIDELIPLAEGTVTMEGTKENIRKIMKGDDTSSKIEKGEKGEKGDSKPGQIFNNIKNTFGGLKEKAGNFLGGIKKALTPKTDQSGRKKKTAFTEIKGGSTNRDPISFANDNLASASEVKPNDKKKEARSEVTKDISKPATGGKADISNGNVMSLPDSGGDKRANIEANKSGPSMDREFVKPQNKIPSLMAIDPKNMHILYAKSVFNIVDAL